MFKNLYMIFTYLLFCVCLIGYNLEAESQTSPSQVKIANIHFNIGIERMEIKDYRIAITSSDELCCINMFRRIISGFLHKQAGNPRAFDFL